MPTEAQESGRNLIEMFAQRELRDFLRDVSDVDNPESLITWANIYSGLPEVEQGDFQVIAEKLLAVVPTAVEIVQRIRDETHTKNGDDLGAIDQVVLFLREQVKKALTQVVEDQLVVDQQVKIPNNPAGRVPIANLHLYRYFEQRLKLAVELEDLNFGTTTKSSEDFRQLFQAVSNMPATQMVEGLKHDLEQVIASYPGLETPIPKLGGLTSNEVAEIKSLVEQFRGDVQVKEMLIRALKGDTIEAALQRVSAYRDQDQGVDVPAEKLSPVMREQLEALQALLQRLVDLSSLDKDVFDDYQVSHLGPTGQGGGGLGPKTRAEEILMTINQILEQDDRVESLDNDPRFTGWRDGLMSSTRVADRTLRSYITDMENRAEGDGTFTAEDLEALRYARQVLEDQKFNTRMPIYEDLENTRYNERLKNRKDAFLDDQIAKLDATIAQAEARLEGGAGAPPDDPENREMDHHQTFFDALNRYLYGAVGGFDGVPRIVTVGATEGNWPAKLVEAKAEYSRLREAATPFEQIVGKTVVNLWDYSFKTRDGASDGVEHPYDHVADNYINPPEIRTVIENYDLKRTAWDVRKIGLQMLIGIHPTYRRKYVYGGDGSDGNGYIPNKATFVADLKAGLYEYLGITQAEFEDQHGIRSDAEAEVLFNLLWQLNVDTGIMDEAYSAMSLNGASKAHNTKPIPHDIDGLKNEVMSHTLDAIAGPAYLALNTPVTKKHQIMNLALIPQASLEMAYRAISTDPDVRAGRVPVKIPHGVTEVRHKERLYMRALVGSRVVDELFGLLPALDPADHPGGPDYPMPIQYFPNLLASILEYSLPIFSRYFEVEAKGFETLIYILNEPLPERVDRHKAEELIGDRLIKQALGLAKLAKEGFPYDAMVQAAKYYISRVFRAIDYGDSGAFYPRQAWGPLRTAALLDSRKRTINEIRGGLVREIEKGSTTLKFMSDNPLQGLLFRADIYRLFGAQEVFNRETTDEHGHVQVTESFTRAQLQAAAARPGFSFKDIRVRVAKFGDIPDYLFNTINYKEIEEYVWELFKEANVGMPLEEVQQKWQVFKSRFSVEGLARFVVPPYLGVAAIKEEESKKH